jgi:hypothetical protein
VSFREQPAGGKIVRNPCEPEYRRNFLAIQQADTGSGIPVGAVVFWGLSIASLPAGCVLADGVANALKAGGSGIRCIDSFLHTTRSNGTLGNIMEADTIPSGGAHTHSLRTTPAEPLVTVGTRYTDITVKEDGEHPHTNDISDKGSHNHREDKHPNDGSHVHEIILGGRDEIITWLGNGYHKHNVTLGEETLDEHSAADVVACFQEHEAHSHDITPDSDNAKAGAHLDLFDETTDLGGAMPHAAGSSLTHDAHSHSGSTSGFDGNHQHLGDSSGHSHGAIDAYGDNSGKHSHSGGAHDHGLVIEKGGKHPHDMDDPGHEHDASASAHQHGGQLYGGAHTHEAGTPYQVQMVPIERIY